MSEFEISLVAASSVQTLNMAKKMYLSYNYMTILSHTITKIPLLYTCKVFLVNISAPPYNVFLLRD